MVQSIKVLLDVEVDVPCGMTSSDIIDNIHFVAYERDEDIEVRGIKAINCV